MTASDYPTLALRITGTRLENDAGQQMQQQFFERTGVLAPIAQQELSDSSPGSKAELRLDGALLGRVDAASVVSECVELLAAHADELLVPALVGRYLDILQPNYSALVGAVRERFPVDVLTANLQKRVRTGGSIRDFQAVL